MTGSTVAVVGGRLVPITSAPIEGGTVVIADGKIVALGRDVAVPDGDIAA